MLMLSRNSTSWITRRRVADWVDSTSYRPMNSSWASSPASTHLKHRTSCSLLEMSVVSSAMMLQNLDDLIADDTSCKMRNAITFKSSFCMSDDVYLSVFFLIHISILQSSFAFSLSNFTKLELDSSPCPRRVSLVKQGSEYWTRSSVNTVNVPTFLAGVVRRGSQVVAGRVITFRTASLWHLLPWCASNLMKASFQFMNPLTMKASSVLDDHFSFFSVWARKQVKHTTESLASE